MHRLFWLIAAVLVTATPAGAQTLIEGVLRDVQSDAPIPEATVTLSANRSRFQTRVRTDSTGAFSFGDITAGPYRLRAERIGYRAVEGTVGVAGDSAVTLEVRMSSASVVLAPVTVVTRRAGRVPPILQGFYARLQSGRGRFITRDEVEARDPVRVTDLLRSVPSLRLGQQRAGTSGPELTTGASSGRCSVVIFVDGTQMDYAQRVLGSRAGPQPSVDDFVLPEEVEGIEIYRGESDTPVEFATPGAGCGTILIWTRRGGRRG